VDGIKAYAFYKYAVAYGTKVDAFYKYAVADGAKADAFYQSAQKQIGKRKVISASLVEVAQLIHHHIKSYTSF
jgi:hypothetical protein